MATRAKTAQRRRGGAADGAPAEITEQELRDLIDALHAAAAGEVGVRVKTRRRGLYREAADAFNALAETREQTTSELLRVSKAIGRDGRLDERARPEGLRGTWQQSVEAVNSMIGDLARPTVEVGRVLDAVARGDLSQTIELTIDERPIRGEFRRMGVTVNAMVERLSAFADEVTRVAREVGTEGKLGGQAHVKGAAGVWRDLTDNVNSMADNLTLQVRNIADVTTAVARGDLSRTITVDARGEVAELKETINTMVDRLASFSDEVTRVAREVGTDGKLGGQARVQGVSGVWKDLTDSVNTLADNLTGQVRNIAAVTTAVAGGDLSRKITVDARGEVAELKETINTMVDQLRSFASEVTRVASEVGTDGKLGGQARVDGVSGVWKELTDSVNTLADNLTGQVRNIAAVTTAVANGDLSRKITVEARGEVLELKETINTMVDQLRSFGSEVTRVAREVGTDGRLGGQARVRRRLRDLEGPDRQRQLDGGEPDRAGAEHRRGDDRRRPRRPLAHDHRRRQRRGRRAEADDQHDGRPALLLRRRGHPRRARGRHRGQARRPGEGQGRLRRLEGPDRQRQLDGRQPDRAGAEHHRGDDRRRPRRPLEEDHRRRPAARSPS